MSEKKPKKHFATCKKFYIDESYMLCDMMEDTGLDGKACIDLLYNYKEEVFGEFVSERDYGRYV